MLKRVITIALAYIGVVVGAGFASGQEVLQYFVAHGKIGMMAVLVTAILMALVGAAALQLGSLSGAKEHSTVFNQIAHPIAARALDVFIIFTLFSIGFVMIAGAGSNLNQQFDLPNWFGATLMAILIVTTGLLDVNKVTAIIGAITPFMIVTVIAASVYALLNPDGTLDQMQAYSSTLEPAIAHWGVSAINYVALAFGLAASMMIVMGGAMFDPTSAGRGGLLGGLVFGLLVLLSALALLIKLPTVADSPMPMLALVDSMHPVAGIAMAVIIYAMIYNTAISLYYSLAKRAEGIKAGAFKPTLFITVAIGFTLSFLGFEDLVGFLYPIIGYVGIALTVLILWGWFSSRSVIKEEAQRRERIRYLFKRRWKKGVRYTTDHHEELAEAIEESSLDNEEAVMTLRDEVVAEIEADPDASLEPVLTEHYGYDSDEGFASDEIDFRHPTEITADPDRTSSNTNN